MFRVGRRHKAQVHERPVRRTGARVPAAATFWCTCARPKPIASGNDSDNNAYGGDFGRALRLVGSCAHHNSNYNNCYNFEPY